MNRVKINIVKVKAGALYYAIFIAFLIASLIGLLILYTHIHNSYVDRQIIKEQVLSNVKSGINLVLKNPELLPYSTPENIKLFGNEYDVVNLKKEHWGAYGLIYANSQRHSYKSSQIALVGDDLGKKEDIALYLSDQKKYLSISGNTILKGTCYLPKLGIKRAYIEGQGYQNQRLVFGTIQTSASELPALNPEKLKYLESLVSTGYPKSDSIADISSIRGSEEIYNSFYNKTITLFSDQKMELNGFKISGNIIIKSNQEIVVGSECSLNDVLLVAPNVILKSGFKGSVQVFATERIIVEESCQLKYPSFVGLLRNTEDKEPAVTIGENVIIAGGVLLYTTNKLKDPLVVKLARSATIYGTVYCDGYMELQGNIYGSLYCNGFTLKTAASLYENHLLNAKVDYSLLPRNFAGVNLIGKLINEQIIKSMN